MFGGFFTFFFGFAFFVSGGVADMLRSTSLVLGSFVVLMVLIVMGAQCPIRHQVALI